MQSYDLQSASRLHGEPVGFGPQVPSAQTPDAHAVSASQLALSGSGGGAEAQTLAARQKPDAQSAPTAQLAPYGAGTTQTVPSQSPDAQSPLVVHGVPIGKEHAPSTHGAPAQSALDRQVQPPTSPCVGEHAPRRRAVKNLDRGHRGEARHAWDLPSG